MMTIQNNILDIFKKEDIIYMGPTGSLLINIDEPKDRDYILIVKDNLNFHKVMVKEENTKTVEYYVDDLDTIQQSIINPYTIIKAIALFCSLPDYLFQNIKINNLREIMIKHVNTFIKEEQSRQFSYNQMNYMYGLPINNSVMKFKHCYYLPLVKHILETNNHNYTENELELARRFYNNEATDQEYQEIFSYFGSVFVIN